MHSGKTVFHALSAPETLAALVLSSILFAGSAQAESETAPGPAAAAAAAAKSEIMQEADSTLRALSDKKTAVNEGSTLRDPAKEKSRVYRDPYGNRITAPAGKNNAAAANGAESAAAPAEGTAKKNNGTSLPGSSLPAANLKKNTAAAAAGTASSLPAAQAEDDNAPLRVAVLYFSQPENEKSTDTDVLSGASAVMTSEGSIQGTVEHLARMAADRLKADVFAITRTEPYSPEHDDLIYQAAEEQDSKARPPITVSPEFSTDRYDVILLGYPIWWYDLPMPLYTFMDQYDLSGKTIVPFCTHGGNRPFKTFAIIASSEPNARVAINSGLIVNRYDVPSHGQELVDKWLTALGSGIIDPQYLRHFIKNHQPALKSSDAAAAPADAAPADATAADKAAAPAEAAPAAPAK